MNTLKFGLHAAKWIGCGAMVVTVGACSRSPAQVHHPMTASTTPSPPPSQAQARHASERDDRETTIEISSELRTKCAMPQAPRDLPRFDYDQAELRPRGANVLDDVAACLTNGPLEGQTLTIIGRTDPRGTSEYNEQLGSSRASAARDYLVKKGVSADRISLVSRGEQGARGDDEASWALDRRVDLDLGDRVNVAGSDDESATDSTGPIVDGVRQQATTPDAPSDKDGASYSDTAEGGKGRAVPSGSSGASE